MPFIALHRCVNCRTPWETAFFKPSKSISVCPADTLTPDCDKVLIKVPSTSCSGAMVTVLMLFPDKACHLLKTSTSGSMIYCPGCAPFRSEEHTSELQSRFDLVCRLLLEKK